MYYPWTWWFRGLFLVGVTITLLNRLEFGRILTGIVLRQHTPGWTPPERLKWIGNYHNRILPFYLSGDPLEIPLAFVSNWYVWVNCNISLTWIKAIWGWFPLLTMIPVRSQWGRYNLPRYVHINFHCNNSHQKDADFCVKQGCNVSMEHQSGWWLTYPEKH